MVYDDIEPLSRDLKLSLPEIHGRMYCTTHGTPCYRGRVGEYVCPNELHQEPIWP